MLTRADDANAPADGRAHDATLGVPTMPTAVAEGDVGRRSPLARAVGLARALPQVASGIVAEATWTGRHLVLYPLGLRPGSLPVRGDPATDGAVRADQVPVLLVHGIIDNHTVFTVLERTLRHRGFATVVTHDYGLLTRDLRRAARRLGEAVEELCTVTGHDRVNVVGHSLGGLIARYYAQRMGGDARVATLVTLGTPHHGTVLARALPRLPLVRQLTPSSDVIRELAQPAAGCRTRFVAFHSDLDHLILPSRNAAIGHPDLDARNVAVRGIGHMSLPNSRLVAEQVATVLAVLEQAPDGPETTAPAPQPPPTAD